MKINSGLFQFMIISLTILVTSCSTENKNYTSEYESSLEPTWQFEQNIRAIGKVTPSHMINLSFPITGRITEKFVKEGDLVSRGDMIAKLDTQLLESEIAQAESNLRVAQANYERISIGASVEDIIQAEKELAAYQAVEPETSPEATLQAANVASAQARLDYLESLPLAEDIAFAQSEIDRAEASLNAVKELLERATLISPIDGTVIDVYFQEFEYAGSGEPVISISDLSELSVEIWMNEVDTANVSIGDTALVTFDTLPEVSVQGEVIRFTPNLNNIGSRDFKVELKLLEVPNGLRWGVTAEVAFSQ